MRRDAIADKAAGSAADIQRLAEQWFARELARSRTAMGERGFEAHSKWIAEYLREEIRQRLVARGWRAAA
jgi:hypothetical protein